MLQDKIDETGCPFDGIEASKTRDKRDTPAARARGDMHGRPHRSPSIKVRIKLTDPVRSTHNPNPGWLLGIEFIRKVGCTSKGKE